MKYYSREWNITRGNVLITRGTEKLLAGTKYHSREYNITRRNELVLAGKNITRGKELLLAGIYLLLAETIYYSRERNIGSIWHQRASVPYCGSTFFIISYQTLAKCMCQSSTPIRNKYNLHDILYKISYTSISKPCFGQKKKCSMKYFRNISLESICQLFLKIKYIPILRNVSAVCPMFQ